MISRTLQLAVFSLLLTGLPSCYHYEDTLPFERAAWANELPTTQYYNIYRSGKRKGADFLSGVYVRADLDTIPFPILDKEVLLGLGNQLQLLELRPFKRKWRKGNLMVTNNDLKETLRILLDNRTNPAKIRDQLEAWQIWGADKRGHVKFTGYYTPALQVKSVPDSVYRFPFYRKPGAWEGPLPTRRQIDGEGALDSLGLEIAYAADPVDVYYTQLQGSGLLEFIDTRETYRLTYGGSNRHPYRSIESHLKRNAGLGMEDLSIFDIKRMVNRQPGMRDSILLVNPSYTFFKPEKKPITGSGQVVLTPEVSVAVDRRYFPLGSVLLAAVPVFDKDANILHHEYRILLPQDVGGAIRGPGHIDLYSGVGIEGQRRAGKRMHYGMVWLLRPKKK